ncbi:hypothetical protein [Sphingomonas alpina]|uniref:Uncharacterized protein n=1 Tax=Sphingomonas alpina TaxID=653931 RepID=A0A7H0LHV5_9SPHN|nr:hypothetical protein [Sphingomonas alpina]QNQ09258.1 hypothetical protein H3Z74_21730 [Sphingomonas alpina]
MARAVRRLVLLDRARVMLGGAQRLADVLMISRRAVNHKLVADRGVSEGEMLAVAGALDEHAAKITALANELRALC